MTSYWFSNPCSLIDSLSINPFSGDDKNFKYNSLTRLIILITIISLLKKPDSYRGIMLAGGFSLLLSVYIYFSTYNNVNGVDTRTITDYQSREGIYDDDIYNKDLTPAGEDILENYETNTNNLFLINRPKMDTQNLKHKFILDGNKMPGKLTDINYNENDIYPFSQQVMTGTVKQLNSIQQKNISPV